jgi:hypothetical protein
MKNILTASTLVLLIVSGYLGYKLYTVTHPKETLVVRTSPTSSCPVSYDYSNGNFEGIINYETAMALYNNYKNDRWKANIWKKDTNPVAEFVDNPDARSVWFSVERLKNFIWHVEKQNCDSLGCNETLGMRIYFAKYPDLNNRNVNTEGWLGLDDVPNSYANHHTLFMVPTYQNKKGDNIDFYPVSCKGSFYLAPKDLQVGTGEIFHLEHPVTPYIFLMGTGPDSQNHGGLIPPGDPTGTSFN